MLAVSGCPQRYSQSVNQHTRALRSADKPALPFIFQPRRQHGADKVKTYERLGYWIPDFSLRIRPTPGVGGAAGAQLPAAGANASSLAAPAAAVPAATPAVATAGMGGGSPSALGVGAMVLAAVGLAACTVGLVQRRRAAAGQAPARHVIRLP